MNLVHSDNGVYSLTPTGMAFVQTLGDNCALTARSKRLLIKQALVCPPIRLLLSQFVPEKEFQHLGEYFQSSRPAFLEVDRRDKVVMRTDSDYRFTLKNEAEVNQFRRGAFTIAQQLELIDVLRLPKSRTVLENQRTVIFPCIPLVLSQRTVLDSEFREWILKLKNADRRVSIGELTYLFCTENKYPVSAFQEQATDYLERHSTSYYLERVSASNVSHSNSHAYLKVGGVWRSTIYVNA